MVYVFTLRELAMDELKNIAENRQAAHERLLQLDSRVYKAFLAMEQATYATGALPRKQKELIAVGISVVIDCRSCMQWHIEQAAKAGAGFRDVFEAVEVGMDSGGPATVSARFALDVMDSVFGSERT